MEWHMAGKVFSAIAVLSLLSVGVLFAASDPTTSLKSTLSSLCSGLISLLPVVSMLMVMVGAVVYASGQIMGAETRARANVWATAALTGALIAILISAATPPILTTIYGNTVSCNAASQPPSCGASGQSCCAGNNCDSGLNCIDNTCTIPASSSGAS